MRDMITEIGQNSIELKEQEEDIRKENSESLLDLSTCSKFLMKKFNIGISDIDMLFPFTIPLQSPFKIKKITNDLETYKSHCSNFAKINEKEKEELEKTTQNPLKQNIQNKKRKVIKIKDYIGNKTTQKNRIINYINKSLSNSKYLTLNKGQKIPKFKRETESSLTENDKNKSSLSLIKSFFENKSFDSSIALSQSFINRTKNAHDMSDYVVKKKKRKIFNINLRILPNRLDEIENKIKNKESYHPISQSPVRKELQRSRKSKSLEKFKINYQSIKNNCNEIYGNLKHEISKFTASNNKTSFDLKHY